MMYVIQHLPNRHPKSAFWKSYWLLSLPSKKEKEKKISAPNMVDRTDDDIAASSGFITRADYEDSVSYYFDLLSQPEP